MNPLIPLFDFGLTERLVLVLLTEFILVKPSLLTLLWICMFLPLEGMLGSVPAIDPLETSKYSQWGCLGRERQLDKSSPK